MKLKTKKDIVEWYDDKGYDMQEPRNDHRELMLSLDRIIKVNNTPRVGNTIVTTLYKKSWKYKTILYFYNNECYKIII